MAFDKKPTTWLPNWSEDGTNITVPIATFPELTAGEADATGGDIRKVLFALMEKLHQVWAATPSADRPTRMVITKTAVLAVATGEITNVYQIRFTNELLTQDVKDEPT